MKIAIAEDMEKEVLDEISALGEVSYKPKDLNSAIKDADILVVRSKTKVDRELLSHAQRLRAVIRAGVGIDNIDAKACEEKNIKVLNTPAASSNAVAELAIGHIFSAFRFIAKAHYQMKNRIWDKKNLVGTELQGKTLGIIGYGRIGSLVGKKALALGMKVLAYNLQPREEKGVEFVSLEELLKRADVITIHVPSLPETRGMINEKTIAMMKDGVVIINTARGDIIDENALYEACKSKKVAAACLDVFPQEPYTGKLLDLDNVYCTPHLGGSTKEAQLRIGAEIVSILKELSKQ